MQEYVNGLVLLDGRLIKKNFAVDNGKFYFKYSNPDSTINIEGKIISIGFIDVHTHTRIPGYEHKEDLSHLTEAALCGGYTTIVAMANIDPEPVNEETYKVVISNFIDSKINIVQSARATYKNNPVDYKTLKKYTSLFTDDGDPISDENLMRNVLIGARENNVTILLHEEDADIKGVGYKSKFLVSNNMPWFTEKYETNIVSRDIRLNRTINANIHIQHISQSSTIDMLKKAKFEGMNITAEITPHHLYFSNEQIITDDSMFKMNPPLGDYVNRKKLIKAFKDNHISIIATDHAPHSKSEKSGGFLKSANGVIGLESAFAATNTVLGSKYIVTLLNALTIHPAELLGLKNYKLHDGMECNFVIIDPNLKWTFTNDKIMSKSSNSPFINQKFIGKIVKTVYKTVEREY